MKISFKPIIDNSEQLNLRISPSLKQRIENLRSRSKASCIQRLRPGPWMKAKSIAGGRIGLDARTRGIQSYSTHPLAG